MKKLMLSIALMLSFNVHAQSSAINEDLSDQQLVNELKSGQPDASSAKAPAASDIDAPIAHKEQTDHEILKQEASNQAKSQQLELAQARANGRALDKKIQELDSEDQPAGGSIDKNGNWNSYRSNQPQVDDRTPAEKEHDRCVAESMTQSPEDRTCGQSQQSSQPAPDQPVAQQPQYNQPQFYQGYPQAQVVQPAPPVYYQPQVVAVPVPAMVPSPHPVYSTYYQPGPYYGSRVIVRVSQPVYRAGYVPNAYRNYNPYYYRR